MLRRRELATPRELVGSRLVFRDGTTSIVYRETVTRTPISEPVTLVVEFKLRMIGTSRLGHALFRAESWLNLVLFAGFEGFRTKLWLETPRTGTYRGVYDWDGASRAADYAAVLVRVLGLVCIPGTVRWHVVPATSRDEFTGHLRTLDGASDPDAWWSLRVPMVPPRAKPTRSWLRR